MTRKLTSVQIIVFVLIGIVTCGVIVVGALMAWDILIATQTPKPSSDDSWRQVQNAGKLVVGTSADYPPFEYYNSTYALDGFDIAVARELGEVLGVKVEFQDLAFEGLEEALEIRQVDAVIAALSVTEERRGDFDFSITYYVNHDAVLAAEQAPFNHLDSLTGMSGKRIGVQKQSVYERWVQLNLVQPSYTAEEYVYVYPRVDQAISDLKNNRLDIVMLDFNPAQSYLKQGGLKMVGQNINPQQYAIGLRKGAAALQERINQALVQMQNDGRIASLASQYLDSGPNPPQPTAAPTAAPSATPPTRIPPTATPPGYCVDGMVFVRDLTYPDYNMTAPTIIAAGTPFQKGWRIRNSGSCTWNTSYVLRYSTGNSSYASMSGVPTPIMIDVPPGAEYDLYLNQVAPLYPGVHQGFWVLTNASGAAFGNRLWVGISVPAPNPATPTPPPSAPVIFRFDANPRQISAGSCVELRWDVQGNTSLVNLLRDGQMIWPNAPSSGRTQDCPLGVTGSAAAQYLLQASGPSGYDEARQDVLYISPTTPVPPIGNFPSIINFDVAPDQIESGACVSIAWKVVGNAEDIRLYRDSALIMSNLSGEDMASDCPSILAGLVTYRLEAYGGGANRCAESNCSGEFSTADRSNAAARYDATQPVLISRVAWQRIEERLWPLDK